MFCLYTLPLARPAQAKIQMLTTSSWIVTILLKSLLKSLVLYELLLFPFNVYNPITVITYFQCSGIWYGSIGNLMLSSQCQQTTTLYTETRLIYVEIMAPLLQNKPYTYFLVKISSCSTIVLSNKILFVSQFRSQSSLYLKYWSKYLNFNFLAAFSTIVPNPNPTLLILKLSYL